MQGIIYPIWLRLNHSVGSNGQMLPGPLGSLSLLKVCKVRFDKYSRFLR